jgi:hypothetical protein
LNLSRPTPEDARILAGLAVLPLILFAEAVSGHRVFYERDVLGYWFPQVETVVRVLAQGSWPLWDPYEGFGRPLLAGPQAQLLYPFTWLDLLLPPASAYAALVVVHSWLAAAGAYLLARAWGGSRPAAAVAAVVLSCSGAFVSAASLFHHFAGAAWLPWVLLTFQAFLHQPTTRSAVTLGIVGGLQILAGSGDMVVLAALSAALLLAGTVWRDGAAVLSRESLVRTLLAAAIALGLSAAQWVPTLAVASASNRSRMSRELNLYWSVHPVSLSDIVVPQALPSLPLSEPVRAALFDSREPFLPSLYLGLSTVLLLVPLARHTDRRRAAIALAGFVFFVLCALGRHAPVLPLLLELPVISIFRYPVKYMLGAGVFWAAAAALGYEAWLQPWSDDHRRTARWMAAAAAVMALLAITGAELLRVEAPRLGQWVNAPPDWRPLAYAPLVWKLRTAAAIATVAALLLIFRRRAARSPAGAIAAAMLVAVDMMVAARPVNELGASELAAYRPPALSLLGAPLEHHRLYVPGPPTADLNRSLVRGPAGWPPAWSWALGMQQTLQPPAGARWGLRGSYDADFTGMGSPEATQLAAFVERYRSSPLGLRLLQVASVTEVVSLLRDPVPGIVPVGELSTVFKEPVRVSRVPDPLPRAYLVNRAIVAPADAPWLMFAAPDFDPETTVLLAEPPDSPPPAADFHGVAQIIEAKPDRWTVSTQADGAGYLVVTEANAPGWRAEVDGRPARVLTANVLFRAVRVPAGTHTVIMRYRPAAVPLGLCVSGAAVVLTGALLVSTRRKETAGA